MTPASVREIISYGHEVIVEKNAAEGIGCSNQDYLEAGAKIEASAQAIFEKAEMIVKVKEPQPNECKMMRDGQVLFTYLHLAPDPQQTSLLLESGCTAIAYETVTDATNGLPLLTPMSQVAGRLSIQAGAHALDKHQDGSGILLGGVQGVAPAKVVVSGGDVVGTNAICMAVGLGADVTVIDISLNRLNELDVEFSNKLRTVFATKSAVEKYVKAADLVVGAVLVPGAAAPKLVTRDMVKTMRPGSVLLDVSIDQGGCFETSRPTTHAEPTYGVDEIVHYCVANMPAAVPRTAAFALNNATLPFVLALANKGYKRALQEDENLLNGLNVHRGRLTCLGVVQAQNLDYLPASDALKLP